MIELKFPDGAVRQYPAGSTGRDVAAAISPSLAKKAALVVWMAITARGGSHKLTGM